MISHCHLISVCLYGKGEKTCRYLGIGASGFFCMKKDKFLKNLADVEANRGGGTKARGDNCEGK